jgi:thioesterase domain-containing protein
MNDRAAPTDYRDLSAGTSSLWRLVRTGTSITIVPLNESGEGLPFYCVHSLGGDATSYSKLAQLLGPGQRVYGIQVPGEKLNADFASSLHTVAAHYVDVLDTFQPEGPFALGGWSLGSVIALEMAQQLLVRGRAVKLLTVFDGILPNTGAGIGPQSPLYFWRLACNLPRWITSELLVGRRLHSLPKRLRSKIFSKFSNPNAINDNLRRLHAIDGFVDTTRWPQAQIIFSRQLYEAAWRYTPRPYCGPVLVFVARTWPLFFLPQVEAAWRKISSNIEIIQIDGTHSDIVRDPGVIPVANHLRERLR